MALVVFNLAGSRAVARQVCFASFNLDLTPITLPISEATCQRLKIPGGRFAKNESRLSTAQLAAQIRAQLKAAGIVQSTELFIERCFLRCKSGATGNRGRNQHRKPAAQILG
jgi:hypothetical protein